MSKYYINYKDYFIDYDTNDNSFSYSSNKMRNFIRNSKVIKIILNGMEFYLSDFKKVSASPQNSQSGCDLIVYYSSGPDKLPGVTFTFSINEQGIKFSSTILSSAIYIEGDLFWGADMQNSTFAVNLNKNNGDLRTACGPAASKIDNALFDRLTDSVMEFSHADKFRLSYDWSKSCYHFTLNTGAHVFSHEFRIKTHMNYFANKFNVHYKPINKMTQFPTPPVGWMTWYAVKFDASEKTVLENAEWLSKNLKSFGANCIWVDWEWYHSRFDGAESEGIDSFNPNTNRYPNGLRFVADEIRKKGLIPALWIGATNDPNKNHMLEENPEWILAYDKQWCGHWWIDPSHPDVHKKYIPFIFKQMLDWGYEAFKWDCLPTSLTIADKYHDKFYNPELSSEQALREVIKAARETIGENKYMMSCSGDVKRDVTFAIDIFDGGRIGGDIFTWDEFKLYAIGKISKYLCYNNIVFYADPDNVVIRSEFNNMNQAVSRVSFAAFTGTPFTLGDNLVELESERVELIKRAIPVVDLHSMDLEEHIQDCSVIIYNMAVEKEFENWNIINTLNTTDEEKDIVIGLGDELHLETGNGESYLFYDFWNKEFLGQFENSISLTLSPFSSKVINVHRWQSDRPQIISTSRHITQGAYDLNRVEWDKNAVKLTGNSKLVENDPYIITLFVPQQFKLDKTESDCCIKILNNEGFISEVEIISEINNDCEWSISLITD